MRNVDATTAAPTVQRLRWVALAAAALLTAHGEFELMTAVGVTPWLAWLAPIGLDVYAYCAFAAGRPTDVRAALLLMISCQALAHLLVVGIIPAHWSLVIAVSAVAPIVCWRVHHLAEHNTPAIVSAEVHVAPVVVESVAPVSRQSARLPEGRRRTAETVRLVQDIRAAQPGIKKKEIAARLGISDRRLRTVLSAA